jgi:TPR repeat protein
MELFVEGEAHVLPADGVAWLVQAAQGGDLKALMALAEAEESGQGGVRNLALAEDLYRQAAIFHGDVEARFRLGRMLLGLPAQWRRPETEIWIAKDAADKGQPFGAVWYPSRPKEVEDNEVVQLRPGINEGEYWLLSAARQGSSDAQYLLGISKVRGMELPFDLLGGIGWLEAAASGGNGEAMMALGDLAAAGQGFFSKDPVRAYVMYDLAAGLGEGGAREAREAVAKALNPKQMARSRQLVAELKDLAGL